ncbi:MAG TPA: pentapeptide repeat-containing protein, partial [Hyphomicrobiaceae bacterium]|nr:pentapeptide repeat-containing protein [Hyphomicrobiaceae bacterium]
KLKEGARAWNDWRRANPLLEPQLGELNLSVGYKQFGEAQGGPIDLSQADLRRAALEHATLIEADLTGAYLVQANLSHARLKGADLSGANLSDARLDHADLSDAELTAATLTGANLKDARNLTQAQIEQTYGDESTLLPPGLAMPARWRKDKIKPSTELAPRLAFEPVAGKVDPHILLGVSPQASLKDIRAAYVRLVKALHPDARALDPKAAEHLKAVNKAYQDLKLRALNHAPVPVPVRTSFRGGAFVVGFLGSSLSLLALAGGLKYLGMFESGELPPSQQAETRAQGQRGSESSATRSAVSEDAKARGNSPEHAAEADAAARTAARAATDDASWLQAEREATSASLHRYLGRYANGRHAAEATAALPAIVNTEIALGQTLDVSAGMASARATLQHYLAAYPHGRLAPEVERKLTAIAAADAARLADRAAWAEAERTGTSDALRRYITAHPTGTNAAYARQAIVALEAFQAQRTADHADWAKARADGGKTLLRGYLAAHPDGDYVADARLGLAAIEAREMLEQADHAQWAKADARGSKQALEDYLAAYPNGLHASHARDRLQALAAALPRPTVERLARVPRQAGEVIVEPQYREAAGARGQDPLSAPMPLAAPEVGLVAPDDERLRDDGDWLKAQRRNTKAAYAAYLLTHPNGRHLAEARASVSGLPVAPSKFKPQAAGKGFKRITQAFGAGAAEAPASQKWQSADEPFIGPDGRIRQR